LYIIVVIVDNIITVRIDTHMFGQLPTLAGVDTSG
jgi:hypothetical protein